MIIDGIKYRTIWTDTENRETVCVINQNILPFKFEIVQLTTSTDIIHAIKEMIVRGAPLIGVTGAYGVYLALLDAERNKMKGDIDEYVTGKCHAIIGARPTAVNLKWAVDKTLKKVIASKSLRNKIDSALRTAESIADKDVSSCKKIGLHGLKIVKEIIRQKKKKVINILTHCNAGWLATIDYGTALSPVYHAKEAGIDVNVWVEETRPRNQGSRLTAWELEQNGVDYTIITDNAGGYVMQKGMVDMVIVGSDRTTLKGDVCNKVGTYKTALAAYANKIPFYAAVPLSSFDLSIKNALNEIPIEERDIDEIKYAEYFDGKNIKRGLITFDTDNIKNFGFDITPSKYVTGLITEKGIVAPNEKQIRNLFNKQSS